MIEFTLAGIASLFLIISTVEISRGMWNYHTLAYAVREGARYVSFRGKGCTNTGNSCSVTIGNIATQIADIGIGLPAGQVDVTFTTNSGANTPCTPLSTCFSNGHAPFLDSTQSDRPFRKMFMGSPTPTKLLVPARDSPVTGVFEWRQIVCNKETGRIRA